MTQSSSGGEAGPNGGTENERFVIVSNRGPVSFSRSESGEREFSRGAGGLVTALNAVSRRKDTVWIASATSEEDQRVAREESAPVEVEDLKVTLVEHEEEAYDLMYNHLANPLLWFVQHGLYDLPYAPELGDHTRRAWEKGYLPVNRNFADAVVKTVEGGGETASSTIMLHDYQLYMTPLYIRERLGPEALISLFVHTPWPETDYWRVLPEDIRVGILESLLSADVLAFHTHRYARNFLDTVAGILGVKVDYDKATARRPGDGREVWVRAYPISIDPSEFEKLSESEGVLEEEEQSVKPLPGKLLLRVDRTDLSKNIVRGFQAYGRMFERYPDMRGEVTFLAQLQPSRGDIPEYARYVEVIKETASEVNKRYGTDSWQPIVLSLEDNFLRSVAAYKNYDALLVNAVRDGMNLVAKEAAVVNGRDGVLVLSENAGAHEELGEYALTVNPFDVDEQADVLYEALNMPAEDRTRRAKALYKAVKSNTVETWVEDQLKDIAAYRNS